MRIAVVIAAFAVGCGTMPSQRSCAALETGAESTVPVPHVILVTLDGVRAEDVLSDAARARLPALYRLVDAGVGLPVSASGPRYVSLPGYREILTGRRGTDACTDNECGALHEATLLDELRVRGGLGTDDVVVLASWPTIARAATAAPASLVISAGRHGGATRSRLAHAPATAAALADGAARRAMPGNGDYRPDAATAALALALVGERQPQVLWLALGDTDEWAHRGDVTRYQQALADADAVVAKLAARAASDTVFIVTADHGRSANFRDHGDSPESAASWLVAAGGDIAARSLVRDGAYRLADIAPSLRALLHLGRDASPRAGEPIAALLPSLPGPRPRLTAQGRASVMAAQ